MKKLTLIIIYLLFLSGQELGAQEYFTKTYYEGVNATVKHAQFNKNKILLNNKDPEGSSFLIFDKNLNFECKKVYKNILINRDAPVEINNSFYGYAIDLQTYNQHLLLKFDSNLDEIQRDSFYSNGDESNVISMTKINNKLVGASWDQFDCEEICAEMNYKVIDTLGNELASWNIDSEEEYFFSFRVDTTSDNHIIFGGNRKIEKANIYKVDLEGTVIWKYINHEQQARGNTIVRVVELNNGNITYIDHLDYSNDLEYIERGNTRKPSKFTILSPEGEEIYTYIDSIKEFSVLEYLNITKGKGDYFFINGTNSQTHFPSDPLDGIYGFIMKVSNDGEIVWRRNYKYTQQTFDPHVINFILEDDGGDIYTFGYFANAGTLPLWMMKLNEHGCLGGDDCGEFIIQDPVSTDNLHNDSSIMIYPNPTRESLFIEGIEIDRYTIFNTSGMIMEEESRIENATIDVSKLDVGLYFLQLIDKEGKSVVRKFLVE